MNAQMLRLWLAAIALTAMCCWTTSVTAQDSTAEADPPGAMTSAKDENVPVPVVSPTVPEKAPPVTPETDPNQPGAAATPPTTDPIGNAETEMETIKMFTLQNADAKEMSEHISTLFEGIKIIPDARTNRIVVRSRDLEQLLAIEALLMKLDESPSSSGFNDNLHSTDANPDQRDLIFLTSREFQVQRGDSQNKVQRDGKQLEWVKTSLDCEVAPDVKPGDLVDLFLTDVEELVVLDSDQTYEPIRSLALNGVLVEQVRIPVARDSEYGVVLGILVSPAQIARLRNQTKAGEGETKNALHVVRLKHIPAKSIVDLLELEFSNCKFASDEVQNSIAIRRQWNGHDPLNDFLRVESAIRKLDVPSMAIVPGATTIPPAGHSPESKQLAEQLREQEAAAFSKAATVRRLKADGRATQNQRQIEDHQRQLTQLLNSSLDLKLQLESLQVNELQSRLKRLEQQISRRKKLRDKIVSHRLRELIDDETLRWDPMAVTRSDKELKPQGAQPATPLESATTSQERLNLTDLRDVDITFTIPPGKSFQELASLLNSADESITEAKLRLAFAEMNAKRGFSSPEGVRQAQKRVDEAIQYQRLAHLEFDAMLRDLELQIESVKAELEATQRDADRSEQASNSGEGTQKQAEAARLRLRQTQLKLDRLILRYGLFKKALDSTVSPSTKAKSGEGSTTSQTAPSHEEVIVINVVGSSEGLLKTEHDARRAQLFKDLQGLPIAVNYRDGGPGTGSATVHDPARYCLRETEKTQQESKLRTAINSALKAAGIEDIHWDENSGLRDADPTRNTLRAR